MNWIFLLISAISLLITIYLVKHFRKEQRSASHRDDGRGISMITLAKGWGIAIIFAVIFIVFLFKGVFDL